MSDNVASLGFSVDSKPLDDAKDKLAGVATEAGNTGQAVEKFNQSASNFDAIRARVLRDFVIEVAKAGNKN